MSLTASQLEGTRPQLVAGLVAGTTDQYAILKVNPDGSLVTSGGSSPKTMLQGLLGHWPLQANGNDSLGLHDLTEVGTVIYDDNLDYGLIAVLGGASWLEMGDRFDLSAGFTVCAWCIPDAVIDGVNPMVSQWMSGYDGFFFNPTDLAGTTRFQVSNTAGASATAGAEDNVYQFLVGTYDGTTAALWRNGGLVGQSAFTGPMATSGAAQFMVGSLDNGGEFTYKGAVHHVAIWNRAFTRAQITAIYNGGSPLPFASFGSTSA